MDGDTLVERVARAMAEARKDWGYERTGLIPSDCLTDARAALREIVAAAGIKPDRDSGRLVAVDALDSNGMHLRALGAEDMAQACEAGASLLRALAEGGKA